MANALGCETILHGSCWESVRESKNLVWAQLAVEQFQMVGRMIFANVSQRPARGSQRLAVAIEIVMVLLVLGLTTGMLNDSAKRVEGVGAEIMVQPPAASLVETPTLPYRHS
jgi:hypothetical protein